MDVGMCSAKATSATRDTSTTLASRGWGGRERGTEKDFLASICTLPSVAHATLPGVVGTRPIAWSESETMHRRGNR